MKALIVYSGGLDSTVLLHKLAKDDSLAGAISFDYGQKHSKELKYAKFNCEKLGVKHYIIDISSISSIFGANALTDAKTDVPNVAYDRESMAQTVVPNRNMIFMSIAVAKAISLGADSIAYAAHAGDHAIYADCRPEFAEAMQKAIELCDYSKIQLIRPFINMTKQEIVELGVKLGVDFAKTWSCYNGKDEPCGTCGTCTERILALKNAGVEQ
ncbi:MAG: 7-cyano-7-deazaguanine synthase QueC [Opitutales bacterium]